MWIIYSAIPPLLLVVYRFLGRGSFLSWLCWLSFLVSSACGFLAILLLWNVYPAEVRPVCGRLLRYSGLVEGYGKCMIFLSQDSTATVL